MRHIAVRVAIVGGLLLGLASGPASARQGSGIAYVVSGVGTSHTIRSSLKAGQDYFFDARGQGTASVLDPHGRTVVTARTTLDHFDGKPFRAPASGLYTLRATSSGRVNVFATVFADCAGNATTRCTAVPGQTSGGVIQYSSDTDWYAVRLDGGRHYTFSIEGTGGTVITLRRADGHPTGQAATGPSGAKASLSYTPPSAGLFFASVAKTGWSGTSYTIVLAKR